MTSYDSWRTNSDRPGDGDPEIDFDDLPDDEKGRAYDALSEWCVENTDSVAAHLDDGGDCVSALAKAWDRIKTEAENNHVPDDPDICEGPEDGDEI
jgi:hypothetical protein